MNKRILSIILVLSMLVGMFAVMPMTISAVDASEVWNGTDVDTDFEGEGTAGDPYQISSAAELAGLSSLINSEDTYEEYRDKVYMLMNDIYLNEVGGEDWRKLWWNKEAYETKLNKFEPIGSWLKSFIGTFDGNGKSIFGM